MKFLKPFVLFLVLPLFAFTTMHKYYISVTEIEHVKEKESVQIITRIFVDDLEKLLQQRFDNSMFLDENEELSTTDLYIERYLKDKIKIKINGKEANLVFIGKKYALDVMKCYLEIKGIKDIQSFEISNTLLFDMYSDQQNIIKTKINSKQKSFIQIPQKHKEVLNFN